MQFLVQRASAALLAPLVVVHFALILYAIRSGVSAAEILARTRDSVGWGLFYALFVVAAAAHSATGIVGLLEEWTPLGRRGALALAAVFGLLVLALGLRAVYAVVVG